MNLRLLLAPAIMVGIAGCATTTPVAGTGDTAPAPVASSGAVSGGAVRWSGSLQPMQQRTGAVAPTGQSKAFGTVTLTSRGAERTTVDISLSTPLQNSTSLNWAMLPGRCGTGSLPLVGIERFPVIEVGTNGRGQVSGDMALALPGSGTYHVNVYWSAGQQLSDVMTCANLRR